MSAAADKQLARMAAWPAGIDNLNPEQALQRDDHRKRERHLRRLKRRVGALGGRCPVQSFNYVGPGSGVYIDILGYEFLR